MKGLMTMFTDYQPDVVPLTGGGLFAGCGSPIRLQQRAAQQQAWPMFLLMASGRLRQGRPAPFKGRMTETSWMKMD